MNGSQIKTMAQIRCFLEEPSRVDLAIETQQERYH